MLTPYLSGLDAYVHVSDAQMSSGVLKDKWCLITGAGKGVVRADTSYSDPCAPTLLLCVADVQLNADVLALSATVGVAGMAICPFHPGLSACICRLRVCLLHQLLRTPLCVALYACLDCACGGVPCKVIQLAMAHSQTWMLRQGAAIAEAYAKEHANLVLVARSEDELKEVRLPAA